MIIFTASSNLVKRGALTAEKLKLPREPATPANRKGIREAGRAKWISRGSDQLDCQTAYRQLFPTTLPSDHFHLRRSWHNHQPSRGKRCS